MVRRATEAVRAQRALVGATTGDVDARRGRRARVTMVGADSPGGLLENDQFLALARAHADSETAVALQIPAGDGRLSVKEGYVGAPTPVADRTGLVDESNIPEADRSQRVFDLNARTRGGEKIEATGTSYVASLGRANDFPPVVAGLIDQTRRAGGSYSITMIINDDRQYLGYTVHLQMPGGVPPRSIDVTGAATRFVPDSAKSKLQGDPADIEADWATMKNSSDWVAPAESGNFSGGWAATTTQTDRYGQWRSRNRTP